MAGRLVRLACQRHLRDLVEGPARGLQWNPQLARVVYAFCGLLHHSKGEWSGKPVQLLPWQLFVVGSLFGWLRTDGTRRFRTAYIQIARKNGKSTLAAVIALVCFVLDGEGGAEVYSAATTRDQAKIVFEEAREMVRRSPALKKRIAIAKRNLSIEATRSKFEPLSSDWNTLDGLNPHAAIVDELHAHKDRGLVDVIETAFGARRQPLLVYITTAGQSRESVCYEQRALSEQIVTGVFTDETYFAYVAELDEADDWRDERTWLKANPSLGEAVKPDELRQLAQRAERAPARQEPFRRLRLNTWTDKVATWLPIEVWDRCAPHPERPTLTIDDAALAGRRCFGGLDLSSKLDLTCLCLVFPPRTDDPTEPWVARWRVWVPEDTLTRRMERDRVPYQAWREAGWLRVTPGNVVDYDFIEEEIRAAAATFEVVELAFDQWNATQLTTHLAAEGLPLVEVRQGYKSMNPPITELERLFTAGLLAHGDHPVARWTFANVTPKTDAGGNRMFDKKTSRDRIDPMVTLAMAVGRAIVSPDAGSMYETSDLRTL